MNTNKVRDEFPGLGHYIYLNSGGCAPMPKSVIAEQMRILQHLAEYGPASILVAGKTKEEFTRSNAVHETIADFLGVGADEIALFTQFSTSVNIVIEGLAWRPGDEVIISTEEHPALLIPLFNLARRRGLVVKRMHLSSFGDEMVSSLSSLLNPRTRLIALSHVTTETGTRLPVSEMSRLAHQNGTLVFYDGAQALGQFPVNLSEIDCDFYGFVGHKWLFGPHPTAGLYVRRSLLDQIEVTWTGSEVMDREMYDMDWLEFRKNARRFEYGGRPYADEAGLAAGVAFVAGLGVENIEKHVMNLVSCLRDALSRLHRIHIDSPAQDQNSATGILTFNAEGINGEALAARLREHWKIYTRAALNKKSVRVSIAAFTNEDDLDMLVQGLAEAIGR